MGRTKITVRCSVVPEGALHAIAANKENSDDVRKAAESAIREIHNLETGAFETDSGYPASVRGTSSKIQIYDADHKSEPQNLLSKRIEYSEEMGMCASTIYLALKAIDNFFDEVFNYQLFDGKGNFLSAAVHYGENYINAHWLEELELLVLGDGDGKIVSDFNFSPDIIAHELVHGIIYHTSKLEYEGESGALTEHLADVFGVLYAQKYDERERGSFENGIWVIGGRAIIGQNHQGHLQSTFDLSDPKSDPAAISSNKVTVDGYLRSLKSPLDSLQPQPAHYRDYVKPTKNHGATHINSGIPSHAFYRAAIAAGGPAWKGVGRVWFAALIDRNLTSRCTFKEFAELTIKHARTQDQNLEAPVKEAWTVVGILV